MKKCIKYLTVLPAIATFSSCSEDETKLPNIVIIYTDDMGYGDLNIQNPDSKIPTPLFGPACIRRHALYRRA
jgi:arylsulfatase A